MKRKMFETKDRMTIKVICQVAGGFIGTLASKPMGSNKPKLGTVLFVKHEEIKWWLIPIEE